MRYLAFILLAGICYAPFVFVPPPYTKPSIIDLQCPQLNMNEVGNITIHVKNTGDTPDNYTYQAYVTSGSIINRYGNFSVIEPGGNSSITLQYHAPTVPSGGQTYGLRFKVCSYEEFNGGVCDEKDCQGLIAYKPPACIPASFLPFILLYLALKKPT